MSDIKEELIEVNVVKDDEEGVTLECVINKKVFMKMFASYDFQRKVEDMLAARIVKEMPILTINNITSLLDVNAIAKAVTVDLINNQVGQRRNY